MHRLEGTSTVPSRGTHIYLPCHVTSCHVNSPKIHPLLLYCCHLLGKAGDVCGEKPWDLLHQQHHVVPRQQLRQPLQTPLYQPPNVQVQNRRLGPFDTVPGTVRLRFG